MTIDKGATYSWFVITTYNTTDENGQAITAQEVSNTFYFYSVGEAQVSYAPYPAQLISPADTSTLADKSKVQLIWNGSHPEGTISSYEVYFGTAFDPAFLESTTSQNIEVTIEANTTYFWKIVTKDTNGNTSVSPTYGFVSE